MIYIELGIIGLMIGFCIIQRIIYKKKGKNIKIPVGVVKVSIPEKYSRLWNRSCVFKIRPTGLEFEDGHIEVKIIEIINFSDNTVEDKEYALNFCRKTFKIISKKDIIWESYKPLIVINDENISKLLNNKEIYIGENSIKLNRDYSFDEIINLMIK